MSSPRKTNSIINLVGFAAVGLITVYATQDFWSNTPNPERARRGVALEETARFIENEIDPAIYYDDKMDEDGLIDDGFDSDEALFFDNNDLANRIWEDNED